MRALLRLLAIPLLTGCATLAGPLDVVLDGGGVTLSTDRDRYEVGDTIQVTLANRSNGDVGFNLCPLARELRTGSRWQRIESFRLCTEELLRLEPGEQASAHEPVTAEWTPGRYRLVLTVRSGNGQNPTEIRTSIIEIGP